MNLQVEQVAFGIGQTQILQGIDLEVQDREIVGLIGPNGSGKSTLLKCIYRTLHPNAGRIELNGRSLDELSFRESALQMAVVAQHNQYQFDFSVMDIVLMGRMPHKKLLEGDTLEDYTIARRALAQVGMDHMETRNFLSLSGGEQQRVILARALTQESPCLILDEPTNHLDIKYQLEMLEIVRDAGVTVLMAVHDLNLASQFCHRLVAIDRGQVVGTGTPKELLTPKFIQNLYGVHSRIVEGPTKDLIHIIFTETVK